MTTFSSDTAAIEAKVQAYFNGVVNADEAAIADAFAVADGHLKSIATAEDGTQSVKIESFADAQKRWGGGTANPTATGEILSVDVIDGCLAIVKFDLNLGAARFLDVLSLYKLNGEWKIVNKMFSLQS